LLLKNFNNFHGIPVLYSGWEQEWNKRPANRQNSYDIRVERLPDDIVRDINRCADTSITGVIYQQIKPPTFPFNT
jgi:hypothetical protein